MPEVIQVGALQIKFLQSKHETNGALDMFEALVPANARMPVAHYHRDWEETAYGLEGTVIFKVAGKHIELKEGESLFIPRGVVHSFINETQAPARMLGVLTPGVLGPEFFREIGALAKPGVPPDPAKMAEVMNRHGLVPVPGA
ncbi:MAG TPA: cupin domain-containing protein [Pseudolabrys sp.]|nr:cupin domain-containing protein [Pseudolabrys sp.]